MLFKYACGTEGRGTRSHHRVGWTNHTSENMAHSIQRRTLENMTEMTILVFIAAVQAAVQLHVTNAASRKAQAQLLLYTHSFCAAVDETNMPDAEHQTKVSHTVSTAKLRHGGTCQPHNKIKHIETGSTTQKPMD